MFLTPEGCGVYEDRPSACRYYALGHGMRKKDCAQRRRLYFVVKEDHCLGHHEPRRLTVREYRKEQGVEDYDEINAEWRQIVLKKRSSGPTVGKPSERSMQLFYMCSYDLDSFREFIQSPASRKSSTSMRRRGVLLADEEALLRFAFRFLKQVLFGEITIPIREGAREKRLERARERLAERKQAEKSEAQEFDERYDAPQEG